MKPWNLKSFALALAVALLGLGGCYWTTLDDSQHHLITGCGTGDGGISGDGGSPADAAVRDAAVDASVSPPDLWAPTCLYHWLYEPGQDDYTMPYSAVSRLNKYSGPFTRYPAFVVGGPGIDAHLWWHTDPYNPPFTRCPGCPSHDIQGWSHLPHIRISVDVKAVNMPHVKKGDIDVWIFVDGLVGLSRTWWSPQSDADRKLDPGHYDLDFVVPFNVHDPHVRAIVQNQDTIDTGGPTDKGVIVTLTFKDSTTVQPCGGYYEPYPINMSTP